MKCKGFSLIELMLAGALFAVFAWGVVEVLLSGLETDRLGEETAIATQYAALGMDAVRSIRAKDFDALAPTDATGIARDNGNWIFAGASDTFGKYARVISVSPVKRDNDGNIDETGGTDDSDTREVTATVTWNVTPSREDSVVLHTYLTRWK